MSTRIDVSRAEISSISVVDMPTSELADGQVRATVDLFGLSTNNVTYALYGDILGYWAFFPVDDAQGCVPVWGFADVTESRAEHVPVGTRLFGYVPMASELVITPADVTDLALSDAAEHRSGLHPWYNRYYRCEADPVWATGNEPMQATMWALFMTGWALANDLAETARTVVVSSASSKTALSLAWTLQRQDDITVVGLTSEANLAFVGEVGVYDQVMGYDGLQFDGIEGPVAFVDAAGSPAIRERVHAGLGERLTDSVGLGATHQGAGAATGDLVGPTPRFFFIPDVAEQLAEVEGRAAFHQRFASAWAEFVPWIDATLTSERGAGAEDIVAAYQKTLAGGAGPQTARILTW